MNRLPRDFNPCVVAPTYNNARTLPDILGRLEALGLPVIAVNDGSTDSTGTLLQQWVEEPAGSQRWMVTHASNRGKGAALLSGFRRAAELGFSHVATMDTDGQLAPEQLPAFLAAAADAPDALIIGHRDASTPNLPRSNLTAWYLSGLGFWPETGLVIHDTQCGLRVYPLSVFADIRCRCGRFGFETEALARAMWAGYSLALVPVHCHYATEGKQLSHLKPVRDGVKGFFMHWGLAIRRLLPLGGRSSHSSQRRPAYATYTWREWLSPMGIVRRIRSSRLEQLITSSAFAHGAFLACMPLGGLQFLLLPYTSRRLRHNFWAALTGLLLLLPAGSMLGWCSLQVGGLFAVGSQRLSAAPGVLFGGGFWNAFSQSPLRWLGGSMVVGTVVHWLVIGVLFAVFCFIPTRESANRTLIETQPQGLP